MGSLKKVLIYFLLVSPLQGPVFLATTAFAAPVVLDRLEASVNSSIILLTDVSKFRETIKLRAQLDPLFAGTTVATHGDKASNGECVQFLMDEKIIAQQFPVSDSEVEQEVNSIQANNHIDRLALKNALKEQGFNFEDYFELIRTSTAKRNLIDRDIRTKVTISNDDVKNYFYNHFARTSAIPLSYRVQIIKVSTKNYKTSSAALETIQRALKQIRSGEPFEEVAKRVSDDATASTGGDLGTLTEDQVSPVIRAQMKKLQIGQVSEIINNTTSSYLILKLVDVKSSENDHFEKIKEEIRNQLTAAEYQHQISLWLERQRQNAFIHRTGEPSAQ